MTTTRRAPRRVTLSRRALLARAEKIKLVLLDVDGVLTDGTVFYGAEGEALKAFSVKDGNGVVFLRDRIQFGVISGRPGKATEARLHELKFTHLIFGQRDKLAGYAQLSHLDSRTRRSATWGTTCRTSRSSARSACRQRPPTPRPRRAPWCTT